MSISEIKSKARAQLGNGIFQRNWIFALLLMLGYSVAYGLLTSFAVGTIVLGGALLYTVSFMFLKQARTNEIMDFNDLTCSFTDSKFFTDLLLLNLLQTIFVALWSMLFVIPGIVKSYAYSMSYYIKADHPEYEWKQCIDESRKMMKGHKGDLFVLDLSFIGWILLSCLTLGIGLLWVEPYMQAAHAQFYLSIKEPEFVEEPKTDDMQ